MALIKCPECKKEISDQSDFCVHCGYPFKKKNTIEEVKEESNNVVLPRTKASIISYIIGELIVDALIVLGLYFSIKYVSRTNSFGFGWIVFGIIIIKCIAITALVEGIIDVTRNNSRLDLNIIEYNQERDTIILTGIVKKSFEVGIDKFLFLDGNKRVYVYFYDENGKKKNRYLGYAETVNIALARQRIKEIKESEY